jgi:hypothetical protein
MFCKYLHPESILPNFDFFIVPIFAIMLGYFKVQTIFSCATNTQAKQQKTQAKQQKTEKNLCFMNKKGWYD